MFILVIDNPFYLDISARKRDFKHGHPADAGGQRVQGLIFQDKIFNFLKSKSVLKSKMFPKVSHVRNYKMQMRMGIHSGWPYFMHKFSLWVKFSGVKLADFPANFLSKKLLKEGSISLWRKNIASEGA